MEYSINVLLVFHVVSFLRPDAHLSPDLSAYPLTGRSIRGSTAADSIPSVGLSTLILHDDLV
jgi:hypothetical protein